MFFLFSINPADPARMLGGQFTDQASLEALRAKYGLDKSVWEQYFLYLKRLSPVQMDGGIGLKAPDLGMSYSSGRPVMDILAETIPNSLLLAVCSIGLALILGVVIGIVAALNKDLWLDRLLIGLSALGMAGPSFFVGMLVSWLFGFTWSQQFPLPWAFCLLLLVFGLLYSRIKKSKQKPWLYGIACLAFILSFFVPALYIPGTQLSMSGSLYEIDPFEGPQLALSNLLLPMLTLGVRPLSVIAQLTRNSLLDILSSDYIRTAKSKGLSKARIIWRHAIPPALNPVITAASGWFAGMLAGAVFVEFIFGWRGLGLELFEALQREDQPIVMGSVLFFAAFFVLVNILVDIIYAWLDPRIRLKKV